MGWFVGYIYVESNKIMICRLCSHFLLPFDIAAKYMFKLYEFYLI